MEINTAVARAARECGVKYYEVMSRDRRPKVARARELAMRILKDSGWSLSRIARGFSRHHTTVMFYVSDEFQRRKRTHHLQRRARNRIIGASSFE